MTFPDFQGLPGKCSPVHRTIALHRIIALRINCRYRILIRYDNVLACYVY